MQFVVRSLRFGYMCLQYGSMVVQRPYCCWKYFRVFIHDSHRFHFSFPQCRRWGVFSAQQTKSAPPCHDNTLLPWLYKLNVSSTKQTEKKNWWKVIKGVMFFCYLSIPIFFLPIIFFSNIFPTVEWLFFAVQKSHLTNLVLMLRWMSCFWHK